MMNQLLLSANDDSDQLGNLVQHLPVHKARLRSLALVSTNRGEGTSTCTVNLAKYMAETFGSRVLIVDANLRHPTLHELTGVEREGGLAEILNGDIELEAAMKKTIVPTLFVVTAGSESQHVNRLLDAAVLEERLLRESQGFDFVVFDCPPVNVYLEATNVARLCDSVILVVEGEKTRRQAAKRALDQLTRASCRTLGVFMNKRKFYIPKLIYDRL
jgi:capsular exopolysaccharide synthesis family protein